MRIETQVPLTYAKGKYSWTIKPEMGVVAHFPSYVCKALIEKGATEVTRKKSPKGGAAKSAK